MSVQKPEQQEIVEEEPEDGVPIVLVTGASGFVATHVIKQLLEQGNYHVRGTVRSKKREDKVCTITIASTLLQENCVSNLSDTHVYTAACIQPGQVCKIAL